MPIIEAKRTRLPLAARIFLMCAGLIALAIAASLLITWTEGKHLADANVGRAFDTSAGVQVETTEARLELLQTTLQIIVQDAAVKSYFESSVVDPALGLDADAAFAGGASLHDLLLERQGQYSFDLGLFLDADGNVAARTDEVEAVQQNLSGDLFIHAAIENTTPVSGYWRQGDRLYQAAIMPIAREQNLLGFLLLARAVDNVFASKIAKVSGADILYLAAGENGAIVFASSLAAESSTPVLSNFGTHHDLQTALTEGKPMERFTLVFGGQSWIGRLKPLDEDAGPALGASIVMTSSDRAYSGFQKILNLLWLTGAGSLLVALPVSWLLAKGVLRPVANMARAAELAAAGNYQTHLGTGGSDELGSLSASFDRLLSDLREKSDIEGYVGNLSRFLPEPMAERGLPNTASVTPVQAKAATLPPALGLVATTLLSVECRALQQPMSAQQSAAVVAGIQALAAALGEVVQRGPGLLLSFTGSRAVLGFSGNDALGLALSSVRHLHRDSGLDDALAERLAFALHAGDIVEGQVVCSSAQIPVAAGGVIYQLERLTAEAVDGQVLVARPLLDAVKAILPTADVVAVAGAVGGRAFPMLAVRQLDLWAPLPVARGADADSVTVSPPSAAGGTRRGGSDLVLGSIFGGRYEILCELGVGGMGVVYKARDLELDDLVAIKMLRGSAMLDAEQLDRLKIEIKLARRITHPNVLRTFDFGEQDGRPYLSMEYVRGMTLRYLIKQAGKIPYSAGLRIARQLCAGLGAAHEVGVLHRDIKPENLILEQSGNAKLMDFGIARPIAHSDGGYTQPGMFLGTPNYSAPEQIAGEAIDHRADIYSSGVLLSEMFCGKLPFTGSNTMEIYMAQMQQAPIRPSAYWPEIPPELEAIILRCIERQAADRYQSVAELAAALAGIRA